MRDNKEHIKKSKGGAGEGVLSARVRRGAAVPSGLAFRMLPVEGEVDGPVDLDGLAIANVVVEHGASLQLQHSEGVGVGVALAERPVVGLDRSVARILRSERAASRRGTLFFGGRTVIDYLVLPIPSYGHSGRSCEANAAIKNPEGEGGWAGEKGAPRCSKTTYTTGIDSFLGELMIRVVG